MQSLLSFFRSGSEKLDLIPSILGERGSIDGSSQAQEEGQGPPMPKSLSGVSKTQVWSGKAVILPDSTAIEPTSLAGEDDDPPVVTKEPVIASRIDSSTDASTTDDDPFTPEDEWLVDSPKPAKPSVTPTTATDFVPGTGSSSSSSVSVTSSSSFAALVSLPATPVFLPATPVSLPATPVLPAAAEGLKEKILAFAREETGSRFRDKDMVGVIRDALEEIFDNETSSCLFCRKLPLTDGSGDERNFNVYVSNKPGENVQLGFTSSIHRGRTVDCGTTSPPKVIGELSR